MIRALARLAAIGLVAAGLSGCISLLPKNKPAALYRFGEPASAARAAPAAHAVGVLLTGTSFQRESAGDRVLTMTGDKAAYIADTRWVAPAQVLFEQALQAAFEADPDDHVRLAPRGGVTATTYVMRIDVRNFETRYDAGAKAAPTVVVQVHAVVAKDSAQGTPSEQVFVARSTAGDNRVSAIVAAYDKATRDVLGQLVTWTNQQTAQGAG